MGISFIRDFAWHPGWCCYAYSGIMDSTSSMDISSHKEKKKKCLSPMGSISQIEAKNKSTFSHAQMRRLVCKKKQNQKLVQHKRRIKAKHETKSKLAVNKIKQFSVPHGIDVRQFLRVT